MDLFYQFFQTTDPRLLILGTIGLVFGFYMAWTIGANDVANSMATSVGSGTITYRQAIYIAGIANFAGAAFAGGNVAETVRHGIVNSDLFAQNPHLLVVGMVAALLAAAIWLHGATFFGLPVSTTHSIVGAIIGFGLLVYGMDAVHWDKVIQIVLSWIVSPIGGGFFSFFVFIFIRRYILNAKNPGRSMKIYGPLFGAVTIWIIVLSAIWKGLKHLNIDLNKGELILLSIGAAIAGYIVLTLIIRRQHLGDTHDLKKIEHVFMSLQVITASYVAFAHGSNDVANAVGPMAAVLATIGNGVVALKVPVPFWILVMGGAGIAIGLGTYGYRVMRTVGTKITEITPSRGFAAEFSAASVVTIFSKLGLPISTTHTLVGAVLGIGIAQGFDALNTKVIRSIIFSWLLTLPIAAGLTMIVFLILRTALGM